MSGVAGNPEACGPCLCCTTPKCATNFWAVTAVSCASSILQVALSPFLGQQVVQYVRLEPLLTSKTRATLEADHGLAKSCPTPCLTHYLCGASALYQEAVYVKHALKKDFDCCSYKTCCANHCCCCCGDRPRPGDIVLRDGAPRPYAAVTQQPGAGLA